MPHVLRVDGVLEYDPALLARIDAGELIAAGSPEEVEIRAVSLHAVERLVDQRHRAVINLSYRLPWNITLGTVAMLASARPFNSTTGADNNGDGANNDRPVIDGSVASKSAFRGTGTQDISAFIEGRIKTSKSASVLLRLEGFNLFNHGNYLGRGLTVYGNGDTPDPGFGQLVAAGSAVFLRQRLAGAFGRSGTVSMSGAAIVDAGMAASGGGEGYGGLKATARRRALPRRGREP